MMTDAELTNIAKYRQIPDDPTEARALAIQVNKISAAVRVLERMTHDLYFSLNWTPDDVAQYNGADYNLLLSALDDKVRYDVESSIGGIMRLIINGDAVSPMDWDRFFIYTEHITQVYSTLYRLRDSVMERAAIVDTRAIDAAFFAGCDVDNIFCEPTSAALIMAPPTPIMIYNQ